MPSKLFFSLIKSRKHILIHNRNTNQLVCCYSSLPQLNTQLYHSTIIKNGHAQTLHVTNYLLILYLKDSHLDNARKLFDEIPQRDVKTWTVLISGFSRNERHGIALDYFTEMQSEGVVAPNAFTLSSVLKCCTFVDKGLRVGKAVHGWVARNQVDADVALKNALLDLYAKFRVFDYVGRLFELMGDKDSTSWNIVMAAKLGEGDVEKSLDFFRRLPTKSVSSWNTIIDGLLQHGFEMEALDILYEMVKAGNRFDEVTFSISLMLASSLKNLELGRQIHGQLFRAGVNEDAFGSTSLIDMYCKCRVMEKASIIFRELQLKCSMGFRAAPMAQTVSWSTMVAGYAQNGMVRDALACFTSMIHKQLEVDLFTLTTVVTASADAAVLELGQQIHGHTLKLGHGQDIMLCSSMIDMYAKCGKLDDALSFFRQTQTRNIVLWSVIISSYAMHGCGREAVRLFELMRNEGIKPNEVSFLGLLTACSHDGLIKEGCEYFRMMKEVYDIQPGVEHFACIVDLFGRAGQLKEIKDFVYRNEIYHLKEVWKAYLSSCWLHKNFELSNWVSQKLLELQPEEAGAYLLTSNTYSANHDWKATAKCRNLMQERKVRKLPGQSWI